MHVIYSDIIQGAGIVMGGPQAYFLERNKVDSPDGVLAQNIVAQTKTLRKNKMIDDLNNLKGSPVLIFKGVNDKVLAKGVTEKCKEYYRHFKANIQYFNDVRVDH